MKNELSIDFTDPRFIADKYGVIEELRQQNFYARTPLLKKQGTMKTK